MTRLTTLDLPNFHRATIGFDRIFEQMERQFANSPNGQGYPPYNIAQINTFTFGLVKHLKSKEASILESIGSAGKIGDDVAPKLDAAIDAYKKEFEAAL